LRHLVNSKALLESIQNHIDELESKIEYDRYRARKLRRRGRMIRWPISILFFILGALAAFAVFIITAKSDPLMARTASRVESSIIDPHPIIWGLLYLIGPTAIVARAQNGNLGFAIWLAGWGFLVLGLIWFGDKAIKKADKLDVRAERDEDILRANKPTWQSLEAIAVQMQGLQGGGSGNVTTVINQINKIISRPEEDKNWWVLPGGVVLLGVVTAAVNKFLGFN
jgi:hypothetical protein